MNYIYKKIADLKPLYEYYCKIRGNVPYWLDADFDLWLECMQSDRDYDGDLMFSGLETAVALSEQGIEGFVQYGISRFVSAISRSMRTYIIPADLRSWTLSRRGISRWNTVEKIRRESVSLR